MKNQILKLSQAAEKTPRCGLCEEFMVKSFDIERRVFIFSCLLDAWSIRTDDPFLVKLSKDGGNAMQRAEAVLRVSDPELFDCPHCRATMKFVCTSTGYMKFKCIKKGRRGCGLQAEMKEPDRLKPTEMGRGVKNLGLEDLVLDLTAEEKEKFS